MRVLNVGAHGRELRNKIRSIGLWTDFSGPLLIDASLLSRGTAKERNFCLRTARKRDLKEDLNHNYLTRISLSICVTCTDEALKYRLRMPGCVEHLLADIVLHDRYLNLLQYARNSTS